MSADNWVVLKEHHIPAAWVPIDAGESELLFLESQLLEAGIDVVFDPRRPGDSYFSRSVAMDLKLLVREADLPRAREIVGDMERSAGDGRFDDDSDTSDAPSLGVGDVVRFPSSPPADTVWAGCDAGWESEDDALLGQTARVAEVSPDGWFRVDICADDRWFIPSWVDRVDDSAV